MAQLSATIFNSRARRFPMQFLEHPVAVPVGKEMRNYRPIAVSSIGDKPKKASGGRKSASSRTQANPRTHTINTSGDRLRNELIIY